MTQHLDKKAIQKHLLEAIDREELHTREAAKCLNLNPCYLSMAKSEKSWDAMSTTAWQRLNEWHEGRGALREFQIPEGEEIFIPKPYQAKEKPVKQPRLTESTPEKPIEAVDEHSPENIKIERQNRRKNPMQKKSVIIAFGKAEIEALNKKFEETYALLQKAEKDIALLKQENEAVKIEFTDIKELVASMHGKVYKNFEGIKEIHQQNSSQLFLLQDETIPVILQRLRDVEKTIKHPALMAEVEQDRNPRYFALKNVFHIHQK